MICVQAAPLKPYARPLDTPTTYGRFVTVLPSHVVRGCLNLDANLKDRHKASARAASLFVSVPASVVLEFSQDPKPLSASKQ